MPGHGRRKTRYPSPSPSITRPSSSRSSGKTPKKGNVYNTHSFRTSKINDHLSRSKFFQTEKSFTAEPGFIGVAPGNGVIT